LARNQTSAFQEKSKPSPVSIDDVYALRLFIEIDTAATTGERDTPAIRRPDRPAVIATRQASRTAAVLCGNPDSSSLAQPRERDLTGPSRQRRRSRSIIGGLTGSEVWCKKETQSSREGARQHDDKTVDIDPQIPFR
jgi:hypothetical protein